MNPIGIPTAIPMIVGLRRSVADSESSVLPASVAAARPPNVEGAVVVRSCGVVVGSALFVYVECVRSIGYAHTTVTAGWVAETLAVRDFVTIATVTSVSELVCVIVRTPSAKILVQISLRYYEVG
jgi:hypothetical protein